jgi:ABC-type uncharacterized transport system permease subunit
MINLVFPLSAVLALLPAAVLPYRRAGERPDAVFWALLAVALVGPAAYSYSLLQGGWLTGLSIALWLSIVFSVAIFALLSAVTRETWRLATLLLPYLLLLAILATVWAYVPGQLALETPPDASLYVHIGASLLTYGLCTLAAVAAGAVFLQEWTLKRKRTTALVRRLPSIADAETLSVRLLIASEIVLAFGILSGMVELYGREGGVLSWDHKTLLSFLAFSIIGMLLILHHYSGLRGRRAARLVLLAYLLLTLAYPGVKFVTDILLT